MQVPFLRALLLAVIAHDVAASAVLADKGELQERCYAQTVTSYRTKWATKSFTKTTTCTKTTTKYSKTLTKTTTKYSKTKTVTVTSPPKTVTNSKTVTSTLPASSTTVIGPGSTVTTGTTVDVIVLTTVISTATTTVIQTGFPTPDLTCSNQGLEFAVYSHNYVNTDAPTYSNFDVAYFKTAPNVLNGTTTKLGIVDGTNLIYGQSVPKMDYTAINHRGYIYARQSGSYTFNAPATDDITFVWVGASAYSGFTRANANIEQGYISSGAPAKDYTVSLTAGNYYPIRIIWGNGQQNAQFDFTVTAPDGEVIISRDTAVASPYLVSHSCDGTTAPAFAAFGQET
ncbi:hypothetical protein TWF481_010429 [Arthrobotrys musiformis]|uniref:PA14 domain-containing protein n=1 Tax=Arthrobotrys musiformis TaxID=47236 RepID=A0AAV9W2L7_9PEZI